MDGLLKRAILVAATNRPLTGLVERHGMRLGAHRFVAGETLDDCVAAIRRLNERGLRATTTLLGEDVADEAGAAAAPPRAVTSSGSTWSARVPST